MPLVNATLLIRQIPPHSRWRHFTAPLCGDMIQPIVSRWTECGVETLEIAKRLIDLSVVSVLLDGTFCNPWKRNAS